MKGEEWVMKEEKQRRRAESEERTARERSEQFVGRSRGGW